MVLPLSALNILLFTVSHESSVYFAYAIKCSIVLLAIPDMDEVEHAVMAVTSHEESEELCTAMNNDWFSLVLT